MALRVLTPLQVSTYEDAAGAPRVSLRHFAPSPGSSDDAPALRAALKRLAALGGGTLAVPSARYDLRSLIAPAGLSDTFRCFAEIPPNCRIEAQPGATFRAAPGLSDAGAWNFLLGRFTRNFKHVGVRGLTFDYNGASNLVPAPAGTYRPCVGVWIITENGAVGEHVNVADCTFLDNPGANSISIVDNTPSGTENRHLLSVVIERNRFCNFGYAVGGNTNVGNDDHSCIYVQAKRAVIRQNLFLSNYLVPDSFTGGHTCIDLHSEEAEITENVIDGVITFIADQCNGYIASYRNVSYNMGQRTERFYAMFDGSKYYRNLRFARNSLSIRAARRDLPVFDFWSAISTTDYSDVLIKENRTIWNGELTGRTAGFLRAKRGVRFNVIGNDVCGCPGKPVHVAANTNVLDWVIKSNQFVAYGAGGVAGTDTGIDLDMSAAGSDHTVSVTGHNLFSAGKRNEWLSTGIQVTGSFRKLLILGNDYERVRAPVIARSLRVGQECKIEAAYDIGQCTKPPL